MGAAHLIKTKPNYFDLFAEVYPEYDWLPWKLERSPKRFWDDTKSVRKYMDWAGKELNVKEMSDWYNVTTTVQI